MKIIVLLISALVSTGAFSQDAISKTDKFLLDQFSTGPGGAVVLIGKGDSVVYRKAFGPVNEAMIFQIASMTKQFTGAAIADLADKGKLAISDPVQKHIGYFPDKQKLITIEQLLSHTSGIPDFFDIDENEKHLLTTKHTPQELIAYFKDRPLDAFPGYSNSNYVLLGAIIEKVSGVSYSQYLDEQFFKPLSMDRTSVWYRSKNNIARGNPDVEIDGSVLYSSGGIVSTVDDLFKWTRSWVKDHHQLFVKEGYRYGLNVKELQGSLTIQHGGNLFGFTSSGLYLPKEEIFVCILSNAAFQGTEAMADYIASEMIGKPIDIPKKVVGEGLEKYTGTFRLKDTSRVMKIAVVSNTLVLIFPDQPGSAVDVQSTGKDTFESRKIKATLNFRRDSEGNFSHVEIRQGKLYTWLKEK